MRILFALPLLVSGCGFSEKAPYKDMTHRYEMPPEMRDCKVYVLGGEFTNTNPLWVVVSPDGEVMATR